MAKDEKKKGKGFLGAIADAFSGNKAEDSQQQNIPAESAAGDDAVSDQGEKHELKSAPEPKEEPKVQEKISAKPPKEKKAYLKWLADRREERSKRNQKRRI